MDMVWSCAEEISNNSSKYWRTEIDWLSTVGQNPQESQEIKKLMGVFSIFGPEPALGVRDQITKWVNEKHEEY